MRSDPSSKRERKLGPPQPLPVVFFEHLSAGGQQLQNRRRIPQLIQRGERGAPVFFHLQREGELSPDLEGSEFADLGAAREEALKSARELVADAVRSGRETFDTFVIADADGKQLAFVPFHEVLPASLRK